MIRYRAVAAKRAEARAATDTIIAQPNESPDTARVTASSDPSVPEDVREPQAEMPSVAVATEPRQGTVIKGRAFSRYFATVYFLRCPSGFTADVEQRGVYRRCRDSRIVIRPVSAATSNAGASRYSRIDRIAADALSEHRER